MENLNINEENFEEEVLNSNVPVLVDFWASWCGPCKMMSPIIEEIAEETKNDIKVCKVNIDENSSLATKYGIMSIPTFIVFKNGEISAHTIGVKSKEEILELLK